MRKLTRTELQARGYSPTSERYLLDDGSTISRRQATNESYRKAGWASRAEFERRYKGKFGTRYDRFEQEAIRTGKIKARAKHNSEFARLAARAKRHPRSRSPNGALAKWLVYIGLRPEDADYPIGDTPPRGG